MRFTSLIFHPDVKVSQWHPSNYSQSEFAFVKCIFVSQSEYRRWLHYFKCFGYIEKSKKYLDGLFDRNMAWKSI